MFAYILHAPNTPRTDETEAFFRRFTETPGLLHAFELMEEGDSSSGLVPFQMDGRG